MDKNTLIPCGGFYVDGDQFVFVSRDKKNVLTLTDEILSGLGSGGSSNVIYYTPHLSNGVLSFTNNGGLPNPDPVDTTGPQGEQGPKGDTGSGFEIFKSYETIEAMEADKDNIPDNSIVIIQGETENNGEVYLKSESTITFWFDLSAQEALKGEKGDKGDDGVDGLDGKDGYTYTPSITSDGIFTITNNGGFPEIGPINLKGADGVDGIDGIDGKDGSDGEKGDKGDKGDTGDAFTYDDFTPEQILSFKGEKGDDGKSVYELAVEYGYTGTEEELGELLANLDSSNGGGDSSGGSGDETDLTEIKSILDKIIAGDYLMEGDNVTLVKTPQGVTISSTASSNSGDDNTGDSGSQGEQGPQGEKGEDGKSAYELAVEGGYTGTEEEYTELLANIVNSLTIDSLIEGDNITIEVTEEGVKISATTTSGNGDGDSGSGENNSEAIYFIPSITDNILSFTNNGGFTNPDPVNIKGEDGKSLTWEDLTDEQKSELKGEQGEKGEDGKTFSYEDLTDEEIEQLKGEKGDSLVFDDLTDEQKAELKGDKGEDGESITFEELTTEQKDELRFTYDDFTSEQLEKLKGEKGEDGNSITWDDLTDEQKQSIKGEKGDKGDQGVGFQIYDTYGTLEEANEDIENIPEDVLILIKGETEENGDLYYNFNGELLYFYNISDAGTVKGDNGYTFTPSVSKDGVISFTNDGELENPESVNIKGEKGEDGKSLTWKDLTEEQKDELKMDFDDLTEEQKEELKGEQGEKGDTGDSLTYDDLTEEQKLELTGKGLDIYKTYNTYEEAMADIDNIPDNILIAVPNTDGGVDIYYKSGDELIYLFNLADTNVATLKGDKGDKGDKGEDGTGFEINNTYNTYEEALADIDNIPDGVLIAVPNDEGGVDIYFKKDGELIYLYDLKDQATLKGDTGEKGADGSDGEDGKSLTWDDLTDEQKAELTGKGFEIYNTYESYEEAITIIEQIPDGVLIAIPNTDGGVDIYYKNGENLTYLYDLKDQTTLTGEKGDKGDKGDTGSGFEVYNTYNTYEEAMSDIDNIPDGVLVAIPNEDGGIDIYFKNGDELVFLYDLADSNTVTGEKGEQGEKGDKGDTGEKGANGESFSFDDLTDEQKAELTGKGFEIYETYNTYEEALADIDNIPDNLLVAVLGEDDSVSIYYKSGDELKFLFNLEDMNLSSLKGEKGDKGETGSGFEIYNTYETYEEAITNIEQIPDGVLIAVPNDEDGVDIYFKKGDELVKLFDLADTNTLKGEQGEQGEKGETGEKGEDGKSAYDLAVEGGYTGTEEEYSELLAELTDSITKDSFVEGTDIEITTTSEGKIKISYVGTGSGSSEGGDNEGDGSSTVSIYFTPSVSEDGVISFTNNGNLENPESVNIKGDKGEDGESITFDDLTTEQKDELRFTYDDFTSEQLEELKGEQGEKGEDGESFSYEDLTEEQKDELKFSYEDLTQEQKDELKGEKGDTGKGFEIYKTYTTIEEAQADIENIPNGTMIAIPNENNSVDVYYNNEGTLEFLYDISDLTTVKGDTGEQGPQGEKGEDGEDGKGFEIYDNYPTYEDLEADIDNIPDNSFVIVSPVEDGGAEVYLKTETGIEYLYNLKDANTVKGEKGDTGETGEQGEKGDKGDTGEDGKSAYDLAVEGGYTGTEDEYSKLLAELTDSITKDSFVEGTDIEITTTSEGKIKISYVGTGNGSGEEGDGSDEAVSIYYTPSVNSEGVISFTNNGNLDNPTSVNIKGPKGDKGDDGESFTFEELTTEQKDELRFTYEDFTSEQLKSLKGEKGEDGTNGTDGESFTFEDLTEEQKDELKFSYEDLTQEQKDELKGEKGDVGDGFSIYKTYTTIEDAQSDIENIPNGSMIAIPNDNNSVDVYYNNEGTLEFLYDISDLTTVKGDTGEKGEKGDDGENGKGFEIYDNYPTYEDLESDIDNIPDNSFVTVSPVKDGGAEVYLKTETGIEYLYNLKDANTVKGEKGDTGEAGKQGEKGEDGKTPVKGTDYFTEEDISSLNIPSKTSQLVNDSNFTTKQYVDDEISKLEGTDDTVTEQLTNIETNITNLQDQIDNFTYLEGTDLYDFIEEGDNITIEQTETGIKISSKTSDDGETEEMTGVGKYSVVLGNDYDADTYEISHNLGTYNICVSGLIEEFGIKKNLPIEYSIYDNNIIVIYFSSPLEDRIVDITIIG